MREFEEREIITYKCTVCGCMNKVHTELLDRFNQFIGYSLKCCGCGKNINFMLNYEDNGDYINPDLVRKKGRQTCYQKSFCPHKDCKLYGTCGKRKKYKKLDTHQQKDKDDKIKIDLYEKPAFL